MHPIQPPRITSVPIPSTLAKSALVKSFWVLQSRSIYSALISRRRNHLQYSLSCNWSLRSLPSHSISNRTRIGASRPVHYLARGRSRRRDKHDSVLRPGRRSAIRPRPILEKHIASSSPSRVQASALPNWKNSICTQLQLMQEYDFTSNHLFQMPIL
jgi:hypothetical protein